MAGYSQTPLSKKLGYKLGFQVITVSEPRDYWDWLAPLPNEVKVLMRAGKGSADLVHLFATQSRVFQKEVLKLKKAIRPDGMIWISWPKKSSGVVSDLDENVIRDFALKNGLVDVKVCAVSDVWSGLKLVIPVKLR